MLKVTILWEFSARLLEGEGSEEWEELSAHQHQAAELVANFQGAPVYMCYGKNVLEQEHRRITGRLTLL